MYLFVYHIVLFYQSKENESNVQMFFEKILLWHELLVYHHHQLVVFENQLKWSSLFDDNWIIIFFYAGLVLLLGSRGCVNIS